MATRKTLGRGVTFTQVDLRAPAGIAVAMLMAGCARQGIVTTDTLSMQRVVIYRNGVAYFERSGHVDAGEVRFKMKQAEVGDFLATLAVMERGGSSVRAAAFPLEAPDQGDAKPEDDKTPGDKAPEGKTSDPKNELRTVVLSLDGKEHDLSVGYVAESPVWRPSYRLVIRPNAEAELQAWGVVQNLSGEDWKDVKLSLIAGAPLAFQAELGTPVIPQRPTVTDEGEVVASVVHGEMSLAQGDAPPPPPAAPAPVVAPEEEERDDAVAASAVANSGSMGAGGLRSAPRGRMADKKAGAMPKPMLQGPAEPAQYAARMESSPSPPRSLRSLAAIAMEGGSTRYDLPLPVTVPDKSATMVMLLSRPVPGEALFLFAPDGGVPDSTNHPFRVARFTNGSGGILERGPIAVFEEGAFLGQGMVDPLPAGAIATVPFALERAIAVDHDQKFDEQGERVAKIENGDLTIERDAVTLTKYRVRNGGDGPAKLLVKHARLTGSRLFSPPEGTDDNVGTGTALVPVKIAGRATAELVVDERRTERRGSDWFSQVAESAVKGYIADPKADRAAAQKLAAAWVVRDDIVSKMQERAKLQQENATLSRSAEETRRNLHAIERNKTADALRQKLTARLAETANRLDDLNRRLVELESSLAELTVQFKEGVRDIKVNVPQA